MRGGIYLQESPLLGQPLVLFNPSIIPIAIPTIQPKIYDGYSTQQAAQGVNI